VNLFNLDLRHMPFRKRLKLAWYLVRYGYAVLSGVQMRAPVSTEHTQPGAQA
jgi:hypothetical protein